MFVNRAIAERGQTLVETALALPVMIMLVATVVDAGIYMLNVQNVDAAANAVARRVETKPEMSVAEAQEYLRQTYPNLADATVTLGHVEQSSKELDGGYKVWDMRSGGFNARPAQVSWDKRSVTVSYTGTWIAPVTIVASQITARDSSYELKGKSTAIVDTTYETW